MVSLSLGHDGLQVHPGPFPAFPVTFPLPGFAASQAFAASSLISLPPHSVIAFLAVETLRDPVSDRSNTTWATMAAGK